MKPDEAKAKIAELADSVDSWKRETKRFRDKWIASEADLAKLSHKYITLWQIAFIAVICEIAQLIVEMIHAYAH